MSLFDESRPDDQESIVDLTYTWPFSGTLGTQTNSRTFDRDLRDAYLYSFQDPEPVHEISPEYGPSSYISRIDDPWNAIQAGRSMGSGERIPSFSTEPTSPLPTFSLSPASLSEDQQQTPSLIRSATLSAVSSSSGRSSYAADTPTPPDHRKENPNVEQKQKIACTQRSCDQLFSRKADLERHIIQKHEKNPKVWVCGVSSDSESSCGKRGVYKAPRKDNVRNHIRDHHKLPIVPSEIGKFECATGNCSNENTHGLVFDSAMSLQRHRTQFHPVMNRYGESLKSEFKTAPTNLDVKRGLTQDLGPKRTTTPIERSTLKKCKTAGDTYQHATSLNGSRPNFLTAIDPNAAPHCDMHSLFEVVENVKLAEFIAIGRSERIIRLNKTLCHPNHDQKKPCGIKFSFSTNSVEIRGPISSISDVKLHIENALVQLRRFARWKVSSKRTVPKSSIPRERGKQRSIPREKIYPLDVDADKIIIALWSDHILPRLPEVMFELGPDFSTNIVRQVLSDGNSTIVIRIQTPHEYHEDIRKDVWLAIGKICQEHGQSPIQTSFSCGRLSLLAGSRPSNFDLNHNESNITQTELPHQWRWWQFLGMGGSLGILGSDEIHATSGGYIWKDGKTYMLLSNHLAQDAIREQGQQHLQTAPLQVTSPSAADVDDLKDVLVERISWYEAEINAWARDTQLGSIRLEDLASIDPPDDIRRMLGQLEQLRTYAQELDREDDNDFILGKIKDRCGQSRACVRSNGRSTFRVMDWALCEVNEERTGNNRHRFSRDPTSGLVNYTWTGSDSKGAGSLCQEPGPIVGGARVHFYGATSGFVSAQISPTEAGINFHGKFTTECLLMMIDADQQYSDDHRGDSGAWIIQDDGNLLVGMLWAERDSCLYFTPIGDIFDNIRKQCSAREVCLPPYFDPYGPSNGIVQVSGRKIKRALRKQQLSSRHLSAEPQLLAIHDPLPKIDLPLPIASESSKFGHSTAEPRRPSNPLSPSPLPALTHSRSSPSISELDCPSPFSEEGNPVKIVSEADTSQLWESESVTANVAETPVKALTTELGNALAELLPRRSMTDVRTYLLGKVPCRKIPVSKHSLDYILDQDFATKLKLETRSFSTLSKYQTKTVV